MKPARLYKAMARNIAEFAALVAAAGAISYGCFLLTPAAGFIVGGGLVIFCLIALNLGEDL